MTTLAAWLKQSQLQLSAASPTADIEARLCLCHVLNVSNSYLYSYPERVLSATELVALNKLIAKRTQGQPLAYLFGYWHFFDLKLEVSADTLIPRPDTEVLVEQALALSLPKHANVLDLGTGTGAIALALASNKPNWQVTAVDYIPGAAELANRNKQALKLDNCRVLLSNWFSAVDSERYDLIVSNPPYIDPQDPHLHSLRYEPITALTAADNGLADIAYIVANSPAHLNANGWLMLEHGYDQAEAVQQMLLAAGFARVQSIRDYGDNWRVTCGQLCR